VSFVLLVCYDSVTGNIRRQGWIESALAGKWQ
jgi:hypothetical protein